MTYAVAQANTLVSVDDVSLSAACNQLSKSKLIAVGSLKDDMVQRFHGDKFSYLSGLQVLTELGIQIAELRNGGVKQFMTFSTLPLFFVLVVAGFFASGVGWKSGVLATAISFVFSGCQPMAWFSTEMTLEVAVVLIAAIQLSRSRWEPLFAKK